MQLNMAPNQDQRQFSIVWGFMLYFISSTFYEMSPKTKDNARSNISWEESALAVKFKRVSISMRTIRLQ